MLFVILLFYLVRRRCSGDVPDGKPKALLHGHEETRKEETAKSHQTTDEPIPGDVLRFVEFQTFRNSYIRADLPQHAHHGN